MDINLAKFAVRILLCLIPPLLALQIAWNVSHHNEMLYRTAIHLTEVHGDATTDFEQTFPGLLPCLIGPEIIIMVLATRFAVERRSLWGYYVVLGINALITIPACTYFLTRYDNADEMGVGAGFTSQIDSKLAGIIIFAIYIIAALLLPRIPKLESNQSQPNPVT